MPTPPYEYARRLGIAGACALGALGAASPPPDAAGTVAAAVRHLAEQRTGIVAYRRHYAYEERGPGHKKTTVTDSVRVCKDGKLVAVRLLEQIDDGRQASAQDLAKAQADLDKRLPEDDFVLPVSAAALSQYRFEYAQSPPCGACTIAIRFTSVVRDPAHGDGTISIREPQGEIQSIVFHPSALPAHADSGNVEMTFGPVLADLWDLVSTHERYTGHVLFLHGWGEATSTDADYRRFDSVERALTYGGS